MIKQLKMRENSAYFDTHLNVLYHLYNDNEEQIFVTFYLLHLMKKT